MVESNLPGVWGCRGQDALLRATSKLHAGENVLSVHANALCFST